VDYGVMEFMTARAASALAEATDSDAFPMFSHVRAQPRPKRIDLDWTVEDDGPDVSTTVHYRFDGGTWNQVLMSLPTMIDPVSGTWSFRDTIWLQGDTMEVELYFSVTDQGGQENRYPDTVLLFTYPPNTGPLFINEFSASNSRIKMDEFGEYDDWAEIYNAGDREVWLADYYLSDNSGSPGKYRFPETYLNPGGFFLVWLDDQEEQGENHATFKISKEGEELLLSEPPSTGYHIVDSISFGPQETDVSLGRQVDGGPLWVRFPSPTPNYSNLSTPVIEIPDPALSLIIYPNPVKDGIIHFNREVSGIVYNLVGQPLLELRHGDHMEIPFLGEGFYIFRSGEGEVGECIVIR